MNEQRTHYDTLGVAGDATGEEIRTAYRELARRHHPDRGGADPAAMSAINEAYRVLGDPSRRVVYDAARREVRNVGSAAGGGGRAAGPSWAGGTATGERPPAAPVDPTSARYPWKLVAGMAAVGAAVVLVGAALYEPAAPARPDNLLEPGSCVSIEANGDAREVTCTGDEALVVTALVPVGERCPDGTAGHRDRQGRGLACVVRTAP